MTVHDLVHPVGPSHPGATEDLTRRVVPTPRAYQELLALHVRRGAVVLVEPGHGRTDERRLDCLTPRDFAIAPADRLVGAVDLCAVYADADADDRERRPVYLLDLADGPVSEGTLAPDAGHHFVLRVLRGSDR